LIVDIRHIAYAHTQYKSHNNTVLQFIFRNWSIGLRRC